ncbi:SDR family oxidoreductase [Calothrix sp. PCC 6303]|uniref:SDR family oxidoreductase n=1 Tax=Calothrix sp. PCC 6303 TaxID=1170562 RepID=UPI0002A01736|nr:SDR family oxidoreductase [Calothrix sp. PCC 6303]AFZ03279.1 3-oxoacyl-(acyl-carrier-protein) reductase [Calothrix sp. PCC 6303]
MSGEYKQRALITGATSGIGKATALAFAKAGIDVALVSRSTDKLMAVAETVKHTEVDAKVYTVDLSNIGQVEAQISSVAADFGGIDILVNNAGIGYTGALCDTPLADWQQVIDLNLTSVFQCIMGVLPGMRERLSSRKARATSLKQDYPTGGTIINIVSIAGKQAFANWGAYCVSKAGLIALSQTLAQEERQHGIRVTAICPGSVNTELWDTPTVKANFDRSHMLTPEIVAQSILYTALLPQQAVVDELTIMSSAGVL